MEDLRTEYYRVGSTGSINDLYRKFKGKYTINQIKNFVLKQKSKQVFSKKKDKLYQILIPVSKNYIYETDIMDLSNVAEFNNGYKYIYIIVDTLTKFVYAFPLLDKSEKSVLKVLKTLFIKQKPYEIYSDMAAEFGKKLRQYLENEKVVLKLAKPGHSAYNAERVIKTFRNMMKYHFENRNTKNWIDFLGKMIEYHNNRYNRNIEMTPDDAVKSPLIARDNLIEMAKEKFTPFPKLNIGNSVRIKQKLKTFDKKGSVINYGDVYKITDIKQGSLFIHPKYKVNNEYYTYDKLKVINEVEEKGRDYNKRGPTAYKEEYIKKRKKNPTEKPTPNKRKAIEQEEAPKPKKMRLVLRDVYI